MCLSLNSLIHEMGVTIKTEGHWLSQARARHWEMATGATGTVLFPISRPPKKYPEAPAQVEAPNQAWSPC